MTEITEHLMKRARAARQSADQSSDSVIPEHLLQRSRERRESLGIDSRDRAGTIDPNDLFGEEAEKARVDTENLKRTLAIEKVSSSIVAATAFISDSNPTLKHKAFLSKGDYQRFYRYGIEHKEMKYLGVNISEVAKVPVGEFSVRAEVNSNWRIPVDDKEFGQVLGKGVKGKFRSAFQFGKNNYLELSEEFFNDADFVTEFVGDESAAKQESASIYIYPGAPDDFEETHGDRYGLAVIRYHNFHSFYSQQIVSSGILPASVVGGVSNGFNTSSGTSEVSWPGSVYYAGSRSSLGLEYGFETTADVATCINDIFNITGQGSTSSVQGELAEYIVQSVIPLVDSRS